jgi:mycoredoxin
MNEAVVYVKPGCPFGVRLRTALRVHRVPYRSVRFRDDEDGAARVRDVNGGNEISPTVHVAGGPVALQSRLAHGAGRAGRRGLELRLAVGAPPGLAVVGTAAGGGEGDRGAAAPAGTAVATVDPVRLAPPCVAGGHLVAVP